MLDDASDDTEDYVPWTHCGKALTDVRSNCFLPWWRSNGKTRVTIEYKKKTDASAEPFKIDVAVISAMWAYLKRACLHLADFTGF